MRIHHHQLVSPFCDGGCHCITRIIIITAITVIIARAITTLFGRHELEDPRFNVPISIKKYTTIHEQLRAGKRSKQTELMTHVNKNKTEQKINKIK